MYTLRKFILKISSACFAVLTATLCMLSQAAWGSPGRYLVGDVTDWQLDEGWKFAEVDGLGCVLTDKTLKGSFLIVDLDCESVLGLPEGGQYAERSPMEITHGGDTIRVSNPYGTLCSRIVYNAISDTTGTVTVEVDEHTDGLRQVYLVGDFNRWNYMDKSGVLTAAGSDGTFRSIVLLTPGEDGLSRWRIYQRTGRQVPWGAVGGEDRPTPNRSGHLEKWSEGTCTSQPGHYIITFNINSGEFNLEPVVPADTRFDLQPRRAQLVAGLAHPIRLLSLNNSLIECYKQYELFDSIAANCYVKAHWTPKTYEGMGLMDHWNQHGTHSAQQMVRSQDWTHIVLQELTTLPRIDFNQFRQAVGLWTNFIRQNKPDAAIILATNWGLMVDDWQDFMDHSRELHEAYMNVAYEYGLTICPVGEAYLHIYRTDGQAATAKLFIDYRHPSQLGAYLAACLEFATISGRTPYECTWRPPGISEADRDWLHRRAAETLASFTNPVDLAKGCINYRLTADMTDGISRLEEPKLEALEGELVGTKFSPGEEPGTYYLKATYGDEDIQAWVQVKQAPVVYQPIELINVTDMLTENFNSMRSRLELPEPWRVDELTAKDDLRTLGDFAAASVSVSAVCESPLPSYGVWGTYNFADSTGTDRAIGGVFSGNAGSPRSINYYTRIVNLTLEEISTVRVDYDIEKYRFGSNRIGYEVRLFHSSDGKSWQPVDSAATYFRPDPRTFMPEAVPVETVEVSTLLTGLHWEPDTELYLAWNISLAAGNQMYSSPALAIDNFKLYLEETPEKPDEPEDPEEPDEPDDPQEENKTDGSDGSDELQEP